MNVIRTDVKRVERYCSEHVHIVNKRVSISEMTGDLNSRPKQLRSEIMNHTLPRHRRKNNRRKGNMVAAVGFEPICDTGFCRVLVCCWCRTDAAGLDLD